MVFRWTWAAASCRGVSHERAGTRLQDAHTCFTVGNVLVAIGSDGAGTATHGGYGASLVCRSINRATRRHFQTTSTLPGTADFESWLDDVRDWIFAVADRRKLTPRDFAATLLCAISTGAESVIAHIGDGCVTIRDDEKDKWTAPLWPDHGEYASTTSFVTDEAGPALRVVTHEGPADAIVLFSDGLERLALDLAAKQPFPGFLDPMVRVVAASPVTGRDRALSIKLKEYLASPAVNERTDDDKTLILAAKK